VIAYLNLELTVNEEEKVAKNTHEEKLTATAITQLGQTR